MPLAFAPGILMMKGVFENGDEPYTKTDHPIVINARVPSKVSTRFSDDSEVEQLTNHKRLPIVYILSCLYISDL